MQSCGNAMKHEGTTYNAKQMVNSMIQGYLEKETIKAHLKWMMLMLDWVSMIHLMLAFYQSLDTTIMMLHCIPT
jgi:hypothetical protein